MDEITVTIRNKKKETKKGRRNKKKQRETCPKCQGTGNSLLFGMPCLECRGTGYLNK